jgi:hypothetical protein
MSDEQVWEVIGRANSDDVFSQQLFNNFDEALRANGYTLDSRQAALVKAAFSEQQPPRPPNAPASMMDQLTETIKLQQKQNERRQNAQLERMIDLGKFTVDILKNTLENAAKTYRSVTMMNTVMFWMGVGLFLFAVVDGVVTRDLKYTAAFAGLGAASFVSLFFLGPIDKTQAALSNLIQAEVAFMNYFEQITFWENYAQLPPPGSGMPSHENIRTASDCLQKRSAETVVLLQMYLEDDVKKPDKKAQTSEPEPRPQPVETKRAAG